MSKSRGNVVTPDDYIDRHGADALRCALLFSAPWDQAAAIERLSFNVALARLMEAVRRVDDATSKRVFVRLLAPFASHLAEELWHQLGEPFSVHTQPWPSTSTT